MGFWPKSQRGLGLTLFVFVCETWLFGPLIPRKRAQHEHQTGVRGWFMLFSHAASLAFFFVMRRLFCVFLVRTTKFPRVWTLSWTSRASVRLLTFHRSAARRADFCCCLNQCISDVGAGVKIIRGVGS